MPVVLSGFLAMFGYYDTHRDNALTNLNIFIPVEEQSYAEVIASSHRRRLEDAEVKITAFHFKRVEVTFIEQESQSK